MFFIKVKKTCFLYVFYLQINVFIIYDPFLTNRELYTRLVTSVTVLFLF